jgi:hypothetical protein
MVDPKESHHPAYALDDIRAAAERCRIRYDGRKVSANVRNLGYTQHDVARCIAGLKAWDFRKSLAYSNTVYDVYVRSFAFSEQSKPDQIYMKLRLLDDGELVVGIGSFHL